jgi:hypothetical protein
VAHRYIFTVGPVGVRVERVSGTADHNWKIEISDPNNLVTTVWTGHSDYGMAEAKQAEIAAQDVLERVRRAARRGTDATEFNRGSIPARYCQYLWKLIEPYEKHFKTGGKAGWGIGEFKISRLNPGAPPRRNPLTVPNGYRTVADIYSGRFVYVKDLEARESEIVTRRDAQQIVDLCRSKGIPCQFFDADLGPSRAQSPTPFKVKKVSRFTSSVNFIVVGRE